MVKLGRSVFFIYLLLLLIGLVYVVNSSVVDAYRDYGNQWTLLFRQLCWVIISLCMYLLIFKYPLEKLLKLSPQIYFVNIFFLVLVLLPSIGSKVYGARRWIDWGFARLQPSEFIKFSLIIYLPFLLQKHITSKQFIFVSGVPLLLILLQPDLGTALILSLIILAIYFLSQLPLKYLWSIAPLILLFLSAYIFMSPYRLSRIHSFLSLHRGESQTQAYQTTQSLIGIGRGGFWGVGFGQSRQKYNFLPESSTDAIFSIFAEELGFIGVTFLLFLYLLLISLAFKISQNAKSATNSLIASGIGVLFAVQILLNLGSLTGILPVTGVPLPLISYGGSSLLTFSLSLGVLSKIGDL